VKAMSELPVAAEMPEAGAMPEAGSMPEAGATPAAAPGVAPGAALSGLAMLEVEGLRSGYHGVTVLKGLDFTVGNEIFAVLGANGAGKTTLLATLARLIPLMGGTIRFGGVDVSKLRPYETARLGVGYVPQEKGVFADLTVLENLTIGGMIGKRSREERIGEVFGLFPDLKALRAQKAGTLSGGESRMVACGRALMQDPKVLLLDEPTAGLSPLYVDMFFDKITEIHETRGVAIVLAEQNATKALEVANRVMVLSLGEAFAVTDAAHLTTQQLKEGYRI
jgi:branched-chain amino acid transport system ATP-binding protein